MFCILGSHGCNSKTSEKFSRYNAGVTTGDETGWIKISETFTLHILIQYFSWCHIITKYLGLFEVLKTLPNFGFLPTLIH